jgi:hypothetical protein
VKRAARAARTLDPGRDGPRPIEVMAMAVATKPKRTKPLTEAEVGEMLALARGADSVELKLTVPDTSRQAALAALGIDPLDAQIRQVYFFDTPELLLDKSGVVVRARRVQQRNDDSVVKLRPVVPDDLPVGLRSSKNLVVEVDAMPGGFVCSASMKGSLGPTHVKEVSAGERPIRKLFSKEQRAFFADNAPEGIALDDLTLLGPIIVFKLKFTPKEFQRRMVAELWMYPDDTRILELSTKCEPAMAFQVAAEARAYLGSHGIDLYGPQQTKTRAALDRFARRAREQAAAAAEPASSAAT